MGDLKSWVGTWYSRLWVLSVLYYTPSKVEGPCVCRLHFQEPLYMGCPVKDPWGHVWCTNMYVLKTWMATLKNFGVACQLPFALGPGSGWGWCWHATQKNPAVIWHPDLVMQLFWVIYLTNFPKLLNWIELLWSNYWSEATHLRLMSAKMINENWNWKVIKDYYVDGLPPL